VDKLADIAPSKMRDDLFEVSAYCHVRSPFVKTRTDRLLGEIEAGALNSSIPIADVLRKVIALGGKAGSTELRDWATRELNGYRSSDELPPYRKVVAPLQIDAGTMQGFIKGQAISTMELPDFAREKITNDVVLYQSVDELEGMARRCKSGEVVKLGPHLSQELVTYMNAQGSWSGRIERLYWGVSPATIEGVVGHVRTALINLVAEITDNMPEGAETPPAEVATNAVSFLVTGERHKINFSAPQAATASTALAPPPGEKEEPRHWLKTSVGVILGIVAIVGLLFALMQAQGWQF
jgi:hypothetical protein